MDEATRLLILGSLPGAASLAAGRYYTNPQNQFWRLTGDVIGYDLVPLDYEARLSALREAGIGLWDTVSAATREGSLDARIRLHEASDIATLAASLPQLRAIAFNGGTAARLGRKSLAHTTGLGLVDLPSSSPAYTRPYAEKRDRWLTLRDFL